MSDVSTATDTAGNAYTCGSFVQQKSFATTTLTNYGTIDVFLIKHDANGNEMWGTSFGGNMGDLSKSNCIDPYGNVIVAGHVTEDPIFHNNKLISGYGQQVDGFVAKFRPNGQLVFFYRLPGQSTEMIYTCKSDTKGNILVVGKYINHPNKYILGADTLIPTGPSASKSFLAKIDSSGQLLWARNIFGTAIHFVRPFFLETDHSDNIYLSAVVEKGQDTAIIFGASNYKVKGNSDTYLGKFDPNGNELWSHHFAGSLNQYPAGLSIDKTGNFIHLGIVYDSPILQSGQNSIFNQGQSDFALYKFDVYGNMIYSRNYGTPITSFHIQWQLIRKATSIVQGLSMGTLSTWAHPRLRNHRLILYLASILSETTGGHCQIVEMVAQQRFP